MLYTYRCLNCGKADIKYTLKNYINKCNHCDSSNIYKVKVKGNSSQRQAICAGYDQKLPGLWLHFMGKRMIVHGAYGNYCPWMFFVGKGKKGWFNSFSFETLSDAVK